MEESNFEQFRIERLPHLPVTVKLWESTGRASGLPDYYYDLKINRNGVGIGGRDNVLAYKTGAGASYTFTSAVATDFGLNILEVADINGHDLVEILK